MSAPSITKATVAYQNVASALDIAKQTERKVDKQNQIIEDLVSQQTETTEKLNQVEMTVDGTKETIKSVETKVETAQSTADTATTKADNAQTSANNAQSTANTANTKADNAQNTADTANTNAQNAQKTADENTTKITTTTTKVAEIEKNVDGITNTVSETTKRLNNDYLTAEQVNAGIDGTKEDINILKQKQASTELTIDGFQIQIDTINNEGVNKVKTSMGYTFDDEGMKINKENADTGTIVDEAGFKVVDKTGYKETNLLYAGYVKEGDSNYPDYVGQTIVATSNIVIENYLVVGSNSRFEDYTNPTLGGKGTGVFEI
jgi:chromosome segregation ATPase